MNTPDRIVKESLDILRVVIFGGTQALVSRI